jgi:hypothetical protein
MLWSSSQTFWLFSNGNQFICLLYRFSYFLHHWLFLDLAKWVTRSVCYKKQELLTLREHLGSPPGFYVGSVLPIFSFPCCIFCFVCLRSVSYAQCCLCLWIVPLICFNFYFWMIFYKSSSLKSMCQIKLILFGMVLG